MTSTTSAEQLIDRVFLSPALYHVEHKDYKSNAKKDKLWRKISQEFGEPVDILKKKWKNLRDSYIKYLAACNRTTGGEKQKYETWKWSAKMEKFRPFMKNLRTRNDEKEEDGIRPLQPSLQILIDEVQTLNSIDHQNDAEYNDEEDSEVSEDDQNDAPEEPLHTNEMDNEPTVKKRKVESETAMDKLIKYFEGKQKEMDETDYTMIGIAKSIRKLSRRRQIIAKRRITEIVAELELEEIEEQTSTSIFPPSTSLSSYRLQ